MKKLNMEEMREVNGGFGLTLLVGLWAGLNVAVYGGAYALCKAFSKKR